MRSETQRAVVHEPLGDRHITITGKRFCQTIRALVNAGHRGTTAAEMSNWALRLGQYIHILRRKYYLNIETKREPNSDGCGRHGRYVLRSSVTLLGGAGQAEPERARVVLFDSAATI